MNVMCRVMNKQHRLPDGAPNTVELEFFLDDEFFEKNHANLWDLESFCRRERIAKDDRNYRVIADASSRYEPTEETKRKYGRHNYQPQQYLPRYGFVCRVLSAERNILPEEESNNKELQPSGLGATNLIRTVINQKDLDESWIEKELLDALNHIMFPDSVFESIRVQNSVPDARGQNPLQWEVYLQEKSAGRFPLSQTGSGLKTIILVLLNLLIIPKLKPQEKFAFAFEELENNLHPALQRRLFEYIYNYAVENETYIFLTTHSHVAINTVFDKPHASIYHVIKESNQSQIKKVDNYVDRIEILDDLDVKASDLLQSNGIIWVEGPSDRIYIKKWLSLVDPTLKENEHYQFAYYGGRLLSHYTASDGEELIKILLTNRNSAIVIDSDKRNKSTKINPTKKRIQEEFNKFELLCWITKGKEIENYLSCGSIGRKYDAVLPQVGQYELFPEYISKMEARFTHRKVEFARDMLEYILPQDLEVLDLKHQMTRLAATIRQWNHIG